MIKINVANIYGAHRPGLMLSGICELSHLLFQSPYGAKCHYPHFADEVTEMQKMLPNSEAIKWRQDSDLGLSDSTAYIINYNAACQNESFHMPKENATNSHPVDFYSVERGHFVPVNNLWFPLSHGRVCLSGIGRSYFVLAKQGKQSVLGSRDFIKRSQET